MSATFKLDADAGGAVRAIKQLNDAIAATEKNAEGAVKPTKALAEAAKRVEQSVDPQKKYNAQVERIAELVVKAGLSHDVARQKVLQYEQQLHKAGDSGDRAFGSAALGKLAAFAGGLGSIVAAFKQVEDQAQASADAVINSLGVAGELQQLGPEAFKRGAANARKLVSLGVVGKDDLQQGFEIATNLENAGFSEQDTDYLINHVAKTRVVSAANLTGAGTALSKFQAAFGEAETGPMKDLIDKALFVSTIPGVSSGFSQTITESLKFADAFKKMGGTDEQALAVFAGVERVSPNAENAAEVIKSFSGQVNARGLAKDSFEATLANVKELVAKAGGNVSKVLGDQNAVAGFDRIVANEAFIMEQAGRISRAQGTLKANSGLLSSDPSLAAANVRALEEGGLSADTETVESPKENLFEAVFAARRAREVREGVNAIQRYINYSADRTIDAYGGENMVLRGVVANAERDPSSVYVKPETLEEIKKYLADIAANTGDIKTGQRGRAAARPE